MKTLLIILIFAVAANALTLTPCQKFAIKNWLVPREAGVRQGTKFTTWAVATMPDCSVKRPTLADANEAAVEWLNDIHE